MKRELYVMMGSNPKQWCERTPLGPYESEKEARAAIREDIEDTLDGCELLSPGRCDEWCDHYTIVERVASLQPRLDVAVKISLRTTNPGHRAPAVSVPTTNERTTQT